MAVPPGPVAVPLSVSVTGPGAMASKSTAARTPVPDAPVESAPRASVMSMRLPFTCCAKATLTLPARMKLPSWTVRTRSLVASYTSVSVTVDRRCASVTDSGTVYGPPPTRNVVPGGEMMTCAPPIPGDVVGTAAGAGSGGTAGCVARGADSAAAGGCTTGGAVGGRGAGPGTVTGTGA